MTHHPETLRIILGRLRAVGGGRYDVGYRELDTADHGLPQHHERVFIVGLRKERPPTLFSQFAGPGPSHAARWPAYWILWHETLLF